MINPFKIVVVLAVLFVASTTFAQKKNSFSYQVGILNHFYDENPVLFHADHIQSVTKVKHVATKLLVRSRGFSYSRALNDKSNISIIGAKFNGDYTATTRPLETNIIKRSWVFGTVEYNRKLIDKSKFNLFYGGGLTYRSGSEIYYLNIDAPSGIGIVHSGIAKGVKTSSMGLTLNTNLKYLFWKSFFLYSKLDMQIYFLKSQSAKQDFENLQIQNPHYQFSPTKKVNHTLTIGIGIDF